MEKQSMRKIGLCIRLNKNEKIVISNPDFGAGICFVLYRDSVMVR